MSASIIKFQDSRNANSSDQDLDFNFDQFAGNAQEEISESSSNMFQEGWIISYVDIITLLLTLFIILLAMSNFNKEDTPTSEFNISTVETDRKNTKQAQNSIESNLAALESPNTELKSTQKPANSLTEPSISEEITSPTETGLTTVAVATSILLDNIDPLADTLAENTGNEYLRIESVELFNDPIDAEKILPVTAAYTEMSDTSVDSNETTPVQTALNETLTDNTSQLTPSMMARSALVEQIENSALGNKIEVAEIKDHVNLVISDQMLFPLGSAELKPEGLALLQQLADMIKGTNLNISVEGHTDNVPINNAQFPSNWELSTARATLVTRLMIENAIAPSRIRAVGYADTHPRASNESAQGRERNRRVSILLHIPEAIAAEETLAKYQSSH